MQIWLSQSLTPQIKERKEKNMDFGVKKIKSRPPLRVQVVQERGDGGGGGGDVFSTLCSSYTLHCGLQSHKFKYDMVYNYILGDTLLLK